LISTRALSARAARSLRAGMNAAEAADLDPGNDPPSVLVEADRSPQLRVGIVVPYDLANEGGVKRHAFHLAQSLRRFGDDVTIIGPLSRGRAEPGFHGFGGVVNIPANGAANHMSIFARPGSVRRYFERERFDIVHIHEPLVPLLAYYALLFSPHAAHVATFHMYSENESPFLRAARGVLGRFMSLRFDRALAVSRPAADFAGLVWARPLTVIPNGVPTFTYVPPRPMNREGNPGRPLRLLFVGNQKDPRKGLPYLVEAHRRLRARGSNLTLDVIGEGPLHDDQDLGLRILGRIATESELAAHYRSCDIFVAPSTGQESFGIVLLEAMASGRPVICSDILGYREVVDPEGASLVPPGDVGALCEAIDGLAGDKARRDRMGRVNRSRAQPFEWGLVARRVREEYLRALVEREAVPFAAATAPKVNA
jgi:phosphatidylinositol alpha-mannosyltransferase